MKTLVSSILDLEDLFISVIKYVLFRILDSWIAISVIAIINLAIGNWICAFGYVALGFVFKKTNMKIWFT